jgi:hypothetical protein
MRQHERIPNTVHTKYFLIHLPFCSKSPLPRVYFCNNVLKINYSRSNPIKSPASGAGNVSELRVMSQVVVGVREVVCA